MSFDYGHDTKECTRLTDESGFVIKKEGLINMLRMMNAKLAVMNTIMILNEMIDEMIGETIKGIIDKTIVVTIGIMKTKDIMIKQITMLNLDTMSFMEDQRWRLAYSREVLTMEKPPKKVCVEAVISFSDDDMDGVKYPHDDPLVITVQIINNLVKRILVENGILVDMLYYSSLNEMGLPPNHAFPRSIVWLLWNKNKD